jgi:hypothetical protein
MPKAILIGEVILKTILIGEAIAGVSATMSTPFEAFGEGNKSRRRLTSERFQKWLQRAVGESKLLSERFRERI